MYQTIYEYSEVHASRFIFTSSGKRNIDKVIVFTPMATNNIYNLAFGDLLANAGIDDMANSNNGDIIKIFATIIDVVECFTTSNPSFLIYFPQLEELNWHYPKSYSLFRHKQFVLQGL